MKVASSSSEMRVSRVCRRAASALGVVLQEVEFGAGGVQFLQLGEEGTAGDFRDVDLAAADQHGAQSRDNHESKDAGAAGDFPRRTGAMEDVELDVPKEMKNAHRHAHNEASTPSVAYDPPPVFL